MSRIDDSHAAVAPAPSGIHEVQAIQLDRGRLVETEHGLVQGQAGQWLVTQPDGRVQLVSDEVFRWQMLRHQLTQMILKGQVRSRAR